MASKSKCPTNGTSAVTILGSIGDGVPAARPLIILVSVAATMAARRASLSVDTVLLGEELQTEVQSWAHAAHEIGGTLAATLPHQ